MLRARTRWPAVNRGGAPARLPLSPCPESTIESVHAPLPTRMKNGFGGLYMDRSHVLHAADVVYAVHDFLRGSLDEPGEFTLRVPIMESRVTRAARSLSLKRSVPGGRSGKTR